MQDPVLTRYDNYVRFFNFEWRRDDSVNSFLLQLSKKESLLTRSFFKQANGEVDHEYKIAFVWSKIPDGHRREIMRNGALQDLVLWDDFERALRNAEAAIHPVAAPMGLRNQSADGTTRSKRHNPSQSNSWNTGKKQDRKQPFPARRTSPGRSDDNPNLARPAGGQQGWQDQSDHRQGGRGGSSYRGGGHQKPHWKNREDRRRPDPDVKLAGESGNGKP